TKYWPTIFQSEQAALTYFTSFNYPWIASGYELLSSIEFLVFPFCFFFLIRNYRRIKEPALRRQLRWAYNGLFIGASPFVIVLAIIIILFNTEYSYILATNKFLFVRSIVYLFMIIPVITTGYSIIRYRLFDINFIIRRGIQYLLAKGSLYGILVFQICLIS